MANFGDIETNINVGASQSIRRDSGNSVYEAFLPEDGNNKSTNTVLGSSNTLYPTQNAVKVYVDTQSVASSANVINQKAQPNGIATLDAAGTIPTSQFPPIAISDTFVVATTGDLLNLTAQTGDIGVVTGNSTTYILRTEPASSFVNWVQILTPAAPVQSVNGEVGVVSLTTNNISDYANKRYVTDADLIKLGNTSNVNSGDETQATIFAKISTATAATTGLLTNQDWTTFNNKASTALVVASTGDSVSYTNTVSSNLSQYIDIRDATKQNTLGFTPENISNKENTTLDTSTTKYPTNQLTLNNIQSYSVASSANGVSYTNSVSSNLAQYIDIRDFTKANKLIPTEVKTSAYNANANDLVPCDVSAGSFAVTLPTAPDNGTVISIEIITIGSGKTVEVKTGGADVFNKAGGITSVYMQLLAERLTVQYNDGIWYVQITALPSSFATNFTGIDTTTPITNADISINTTTRVLTVVPPLGYFNIFVDGSGVITRIRKTGTINFPAMTDTSGSWYFYFDNTGTAVTTQTAWSTEYFSIICPVYRLYWNATQYSFTVTAANATLGTTYTNNGKTYTVLATIAGSTTLKMSCPSGDPEVSGTLTKTGAGAGDATITFSAFSSADKLVAQYIEYHLNDIPADTHQWMHLSGAIWGGGLDNGALKTNVLASGTPATNGSNAVIGITTTRNIDDNLEYSIINSTSAISWNQDMGSIVPANLTSSTGGQFKIFIQDVAGLVTILPATRFPFPWNTSTNIPEFISATGVRTPITSTNFFTVFVYATQNPTAGEAMKLVTATAQYTNITNARAYNWVDIQNAYPLLGVDGELRPMYRLIFEYRSSYNVGTKYTALREIQDLRKTIVSSTTTIAGSLPASSVTNVAYGTIASTNVQSALNELSDEKVNLLGLAGGQTIKGGTLTTEGLTLQANAADTTTGTIGLYGLQTKLFQNGANADAYATQRSSGILNFESSQWNGSAELKGNWTVQSIPSTVNNTTLLTFLYNGAGMMSIDSGAALNMLGIVRSIYGNNVTTGPQAVHFILQNTNTTVGDYTSIWNRNGGNMYTGSIAFKNTSHSATVGSADLEIWLANGAAARKTSAFMADGSFKMTQVGADATGYADQRASNLFILEGSSWNGSSAYSSQWTMQNTNPSTGAERSSFILKKGSTAVLSITSTGVNTPGVATWGIQSNVTVSTTTTNTIAGTYYSLINSSTNVNNATIVQNINAGGMTTGGVLFRNTSHHATTGSADLEIWLANGAAARKTSAFMADGSFKITQNGADATGYADQRASNLFILEGSSWNGSSAYASQWTMQNTTPSGISERSSFILKKGSTAVLSITSTGVNTPGVATWGIQSNVTVSTTTTNTIAGTTYTLQNTNTNVGNASLIQNVNAAGMLTGGVLFRNTSHHATTGSANIEFWLANGGAAAKAFEFSAKGSAVVGIQAAVATNATDGFLYIPTCAGTPSGTPTAYTGKCAMVMDTTNHKAYIYDGSWIALN